MMDRRELLHRITMTLGGAITASAASGILAGCVATPATQELDGPTPMGATGNFLTPLEMATITSMADQIIPKTDTPGALDVGVPAFIDRMLAGYYTGKERGIIRAGLTTVSADAKARHGLPFPALTSDQQVEMMKGYDRAAYAAPVAPGSDPHFFRFVKELTITGFCSSEAGATKLMRYEQTPGPFRGDVPLKEIGKVWALG